MDVRDLIQSVEGNLQEFHHIFDRIDADAENALPNGSSKLVKELLHTLSDVQYEVVQFRLKKILAEEHPYLPQINVNKSKHRHSKSSMVQIIRDFVQQRNYLIKLLYSLPSDSWERTGVHEMEGHVTFGELIRRMAEKDQQVLSSLNQVLAQH